MVGVKYFMGYFYIFIDMFYKYDRYLITRVKKKLINICNIYQYLTFCSSLDFKVGTPAAISISASIAGMLVCITCLQASGLT